MQLSYGQLERTLESFLQITPDRVGTFRSRIKQLQRLEFPSGVNIGRGAKMAYGGVHLFKLASVFELIGLGMPAQLSTELVEKHWQILRAGYGLAFSNLVLPLEGYANFCVRIESFSMHDIQYKRGKRAAQRSNAYLEDALALANSIVSEAGEPRASSIIVPVRAVFDEITRLIEPATGLLIGSSDEELQEWIPVGEIENAAFIEGWPDSRNETMRKMWGVPIDEEARMAKFEATIAEFKIDMTKLPEEITDVDPQT